MTVKQLHQITTVLIARKKGDLDVMVNTTTFPESENGTIMPVEAAGVERVQGADDSGPVGPKFPMLVLTGSEANA